MKKFDFNKYCFKFCIWAYLTIFKTFLGHTIISIYLGHIIISEKFGNNKIYLEILQLELFATIHTVLGHNIVIKSFEVKL